MIQGENLSWIYLICRVLMILIVLEKNYQILESLEIENGGEK